MVRDLSGRDWEEAQELSLLVCKLLEQTATPLVLDADGLYAIKDRKELLCRRYEKGLTTILTPHEGEFAYLGGDLSEGRKMAAPPIRAEVWLYSGTEGPGDCHGLAGGKGLYQYDRK